MKVTFIKGPGGVMHPASEQESKRMDKFKTGGAYVGEFKRTRNPKFHRKMFAFLNFCFQYWKGDNDFQDEVAQFTTFRNHLTVLAGFYTQTVNLEGEVRIEAKSLSFGEMDPEEFEQCYEAIIRVAMRKLFKDADNQTKRYVMEFFD